jgi:hypothetical protein
MARSYTAEQLKVINKVATNEFDGFIKIDKDKNQTTIMVVKIHITIIMIII